MRQIPGGATLRGRQWWIGLLAAFAVSGVINSSGVTSLSGVTGVSRVTGLHGMTSLSVITGWGGILDWADSCGSRGSCGYDAASGHHPTGVYGVPRWFGRTAVGGEIGFVEDFALAPDRAAALKQLVPGTDDYYYYHALQLLNTQQFDKARELLGPWLERHNRTPRWVEIETRLALLTYSKDPAKTLDFLRNRLGLRFDHRKETVGAAPDLPTAFNNELASRQTLLRRALAEAPLLNGIEDAGLELLGEQVLNADQRRNLLQRLSRPDYPALVKLVIDDLNAPNSPGFGAFPIHSQLLLSQLEECLTLKADLLNQEPFVRAYLAKLQPAPDDDWRNDAALRDAYLERLEKFVNRLAPVHNSLKAHVLYQRLASDRSQGKYDAARFLAYLKLPRPLPYVARKLLERDENRAVPANLNADYSGSSLFPPVGYDEPLVRDYLAHFFVAAADFKEYEPYIDDTYLKHLFAETKIVNGLGDVEQWASLLPPELFRQLKERVDIDFAPANKSRFAVGEPIALELLVKNVPTLIVKVFEINTVNFYREELREIDTDIKLDGLVANDESVANYADPPLRRVARRFEFPRLGKPGIYVVDFIGNGRSSRALLRVGQLRQLARVTPNGFRFTVLDEQHRQVKDAKVWLEGREFSPSEDGTVLVPFSTRPGRRPIVLERAGFASLDSFNHDAEKLGLTAGFYVERESLITRRKAQVAIRPGLTVNGSPVSLKTLEDVRLTIISTNHDGVATSQVVPGVVLHEDRETTHEFLVPSRLASLRFELRGKALVRSTGEKIELAAAEQFAVNEIERTEKVEHLLLGRYDGRYAIDLLGRSGEPRPGRALQLLLKHREFRLQIRQTLRTDERGRVDLGALEGIESVSATGPEGVERVWRIERDSHTYPATLHGRAGEILTLPYFNPRGITATAGANAAPANAAPANAAPANAAPANAAPANAAPAEPRRGELALLEIRGGTYVADRFASLRIRNGLLELADLPPGDFDLWIKDANVRIRVRIVAGQKLGNYVLGNVRHLETAPLAPLQIDSVSAANDQVRIQLRNASPYTRVHLFGARFVPAFSAYEQLSRVRAAEPFLFTPGTTPSVYVTGRDIGDEYRYILDRKYARKFAGNSLDRPSLLLNPWAVRSTATGQIVAAAGDAFRGVDAGAEGAADQMAKRMAGETATGDFANLDFLGEGGAAVLNLAPNADGVVVVPRAALGTASHLRIVAADPLQATGRSLSLPEAKPAFLDLRLADGLDPAGHFTQRKQISLVGANEPFSLADIASSRFEYYDHLGRVHSLYSTLTQEPRLNEFRFILDWPTLPAERKRELYSKHACHELSFFLYRKDPEFFAAVIKPYLVNKKDKTFIDQWLLQADLSDYLRPWAHGQLNIVERILLAQRIAAERPRQARHVGDLFALLPPNTDQFIRLFDTAVRGGELDSNDRLGVNAAREATVERQLMDRAAAAAPPAPPPAAAPAPGAAFGMAPVAKSAEALRSRAGLGGMPGGGDGKPQASNAARLAAGGRDKDAQRKLQDESLKRDGRANAASAKAEKKAGANRAEAEQAKQALDGLLAEPLEADAVRQLYRNVDPTREWAENNYHQVPVAQQTADLIKVNAFWRDYAEHDPAKPFLSRNLAEAANSFPEMMFALAVLDLPFAPAKVESKFEGRRMTLASNGPLVAFHEEVRPAQAPAGAATILVSQNYFKLGDRTRVENGETVDKYVTEEFLVHTVYGGQIVVTNTTSTRQKLSILIETPRGAIPVLNSQPTKTFYVTLEPYNTRTFEYHFYFPLPGKFPQFPVHVARNEVVVAAAPPATFNVVAQLTKLDLQSWDYVSQNGSNDEVLAFLGRENVQRLNLDKIAFRLGEKAFFEKVVLLLAERRLYHPTLWSYSLVHDVPSAAREFLRHSEPIVAACGGWLESPLLTIDPVERRTFEHLEYKPLVNARAHALGKRRQIVNDRLDAQYHALLRQLGYLPKLADSDWLAVTYYLLLQDRVADALEAFAKVDAAKVATRMQYDYCAAYLKISVEDLPAARAIAAKYADHPVDRWRNAFAAVIAQIDEAQGAATATVDAEDRTQQQTKLAATEPSLEMKVEAGKVTVNYQNLRSVRVNYYVMDVELLFSRNPFVQQFSGQFSAIRPNQSMELALPEKQTTLTTPLPESLRNRNVLVEVTGGGQTRSQAYYSNSLTVQVIENFGQVKVAHAATNKPLAKVYVKVYARTDSGEVKFYKDGYTDVRGRFEYASLSTNDLGAVSQFSVLVLSEEHGVVVREAAPPPQ